MAFSLSWRHLRVPPGGAGSAQSAGLLEVPEAPEEDLWCRLAHPGRFSAAYHYRRA